EVPGEAGVIKTWIHESGGHGLNDDGSDGNGGFEKVGRQRDRGCRSWRRLKRKGREESTILLRWCGDIGKLPEIRVARLPICHRIVCLWLIGRRSSPEARCEQDRRDNQQSDGDGDLERRSAHGITVPF